MKKIITVLLLAIASGAHAQWSNTTNQFFDSLHMPVCTEVGVQETPIVLQSFPDSGYFIIWQDRREGFYSNTKVYAQKYDKNGNRLWAENGLPVATGPNARHYTVSSNQDYRNRSVAATDSAGGLFITYADDSISTYVWQRLCVQHMRNDGSVVFPGIGNVVVTSASANLNFASQLIPDGGKGFYLSYKNVFGNDYIYVYGYKDEGGVLKNYGGGIMNENAAQRSRISPCGIQYYLDYPSVTIIDYNIWSDGQGGCNVIMNMNGNAGDQYGMLCYNRVWKAKKDSKVSTYQRNTSGTACQATTTYKKGDAYRLYTFKKDVMITTCGTLDGQTVYVVTSERLLSNGYQLIDGSYTTYYGGGYDYNYPKGVTISTPGNINVDVMAVTKRTYTNNTVSDFVVMGYAYPAEKFDSVPYQRASYTNPDIGNNPNPPLQQNQLNFFRDTLLAAGNYYMDFSLAGGGKDIYSSGLMSTTGDRVVRLQHMSVERISPDSFAIGYKTNTKYGVAIGKEINTGFSGYNVSYDFPLVTVSNGTALFYIREYYRSARVSPIVNGAELSWGAMGKPVSTGVYNNSYYNFEQPFAAIDPSGKTGVITWKDNKNIPGSTSDNIFMRHLDSLDMVNYLPPIKPIKLLPNPYGGTISNPAVLMGTSKRYTTIEAYNSYGSNPGTSTVMEILDNYNLGVVQVSVLQNSSTIRKYNNQPYLDRNYSVKVENNPIGANVNVRLYFTTEEFNALKAADNSIVTPGDLEVIKQPNNTIAPPSTYVPVAGEQVLLPSSWKAVSGGYYVEITTSGFSNFFILKTSAIALCAGGNASISASAAGANYQWQLNTGSGFTNITNSSVYTGTNTANLQFTNIPSAWYGYKYRCLVDGNPGTEFYLRFLNTWTGAVNASWENAANWSCGIVPDANTDVIINSGAVGLSSNASCRTITVSPGVLFVVNPGFKLTVTH